MRPDAPAEWHRDLARLTGNLSLAVVRRRIGSAELRDNATTLERVAREMRTAAEEKKRESN